MSEIQNEVDATGEVGEVYTTQAGMDIANPELQCSGWEQITPSTRVAVESRDIGMHQRWWVWRRANAGTWKGAEQL